MRGRRIGTKNKSAFFWRKRPLETTTSREAYLVAVVGGEGGEIRGADDGGDDQDEGGHRGEHRARAVVRPTAVPREGAVPKLLRLRRRVACFSRRVGTHHRSAVRVRATRRRRGLGRPGVCAVSAHARPPRCGRSDSDGEARGALLGPILCPPRWMTKGLRKSRDERSRSVRPVLADEITVGTNRLWIDGSEVVVPVLHCAKRRMNDQSVKSENADDALLAQRRR